MTVHKFKTCACGHADLFHDPKGKGRCVYGHGTATGGCDCVRFHRRSRSTVDGLPSDTSSVQVLSATNLSKAIDDVVEALKRLQSEWCSSADRPMPKRDDKTSNVVSTMRDFSASSGVQRETQASSLTGAERKVLTVLAQHPNGRTKMQVAILSGYSAKSSGFKNTLSALRTSGGLQGDGDCMVITEAGRRALGAVPSLPLGGDLLDYWQSKVGKCERALLRSLASAYPRRLEKELLARNAGYSIASSGFKNALSRLRTLGLIAGSSELVLSSELHADGTRAT